MLATGAWGQWRETGRSKNLGHCSILRRVTRKQLPGSPDGEP